MPENYTYEDDGKIHTRYSDLVRCTNGQIGKVVMEQEGQATKFVNIATAHGTVRHQMFSEEIKETGKIPPQFGIDLSCPAENSEKELAVEMFPGVVIHGQIDSFNDDWIGDFKTTGKGAVAYRSSKQILFYAWLLSAYGIKINNSYYFCEIWDPEREKILKYEYYEKEIKEKDIEYIKNWAWERVQRLARGLKA